MPAGSGMAVVAIKSLKSDKGIRVVSVDSDKLASGLYLSHKSYIVPRFDDVSFYTSLKKVISRERIDVVIPALDTILLDFSKKKAYFEEMGTKVLVSSPSAIEVSRDKWRTFETLRRVVPMPRSFISKKDVDIAYPLIVKPRAGSGSQNVQEVHSAEELDFFWNRTSNPIIQEDLAGKEYTIDCLADQQGKLLLSIPRERIETKAGISIKGKTIKHKGLEEMADKISSKIKFYGPFCFQAKEDKSGAPRLTEINARLSGTMCLSNTSGPNIHCMSARLCMGESVEIPETKYGVYLTRYWEEIYLTEEMMSSGIDQEAWL